MITDTSVRTEGARMREGPPVVDMGAVQDASFLIRRSRFYSVGRIALRPLATLD